MREIKVGWQTLLGQKMKGPKFSFRGRMLEMTLPIVRYWSEALSYEQL